jgi:catechol 2,3-dioxygenase
VRNVRSHEGTRGDTRRVRFRRDERLLALGAVAASAGRGAGPGPPLARKLRVVAETIDPRVDIGHVHLKVSDIDRALAFYRDVLGFDVTQRLGDEAAFISAGGYHHHLGLNTWESRGGEAPPPGTTGLYHVAIRYPDRATLADALRRIVQAGIPITGASDHGVSEAIYLRDPDGNGIELYRDRPREEWPRASGDGVAMFTAPLDLDALLAEA